MNGEIINQIETMLRNIGYTGTITATDDNTVTIFLSEPSTTQSQEPSTTQSQEPSTTQSQEPSTAQSQEQSTTQSQEQSTTQSQEPSTTQLQEPPLLEAIIKQQTTRIEALTNKLNEIFKVSPSAQPKNEWESYLDNPNSATYRAMKEAGLIKEK